MEMSGLLDVSVIFTSKEETFTSRHFLPLKLLELALETFYLTPAK